MKPKTYKPLSIACRDEKQYLKLQNLINDCTRITKGSQADFLLDLLTGFWKKNKKKIGIAR